MRRILPFALLALTGCDRCATEVINGIPDPVDQIDIFDQKQAAKVDVLWLSDNSPTMQAEQKKLANGFKDFFNQLVISSVDYHMGVITQDINDHGVLRPYTGPAVEGAAPGVRFLSSATPCSNPDVDITGLATEADIDAALLAPCPAQLVFRNLIQTGLGTAVFEQSFVQAAAALGVNDVDPVTGLPANDPPPENAGFIRPDAALYIVFVSDEDEGAKNDGTPVRYYQRLFESLKGAGNENKVAIAAITGYPAQARPGASAPPPIDEACAVLETTFDAVTTNDDPRAASFLEDLRTFSNGCFDEQDPAHSAASFAETGGRYIELACRSGGVVANMCSSDYSKALDALGANAAGLLRKFPLSKSQELVEWGADCIPDTQDDINLDCDGDQKTNGPLDAPLCVTALGIPPIETATAPHLVPRDDNNGWSLEAATNSIRFNGGFVPKPGTQVQIRYGMKPANRKCGQ